VNAFLLDHEVGLRLAFSAAEIARFLGTVSEAI